MGTIIAKHPCAFLSVITARTCLFFCILIRLRLSIHGNQWEFLKSKLATLTACYVSAEGNKFYRNSNKADEFSYRIIGWRCSYRTWLTPGWRGGGAGLYSEASRTWQEYIRSLPQGAEPRRASPLPERAGIPPLLSRTSFWLAHDRKNIPQKN